jgi:hypothetical protein
MAHARGHQLEMLWILFPADNVRHSRKHPPTRRKKARQPLYTFRFPPRAIDRNSSFPISPVLRSLFVSGL